MSGWEPNRGECPAWLVRTNRRVHVRLRNGFDSSKSALDASGWPAWSDRKPATDWKLTGSPGDILEWKAIE